MSESFTIDEPLVTDKMMASVESFKTRPDEPYGIQIFNPNNTKHTQALNDMDRHPSSYEYVYPGRPLDSQEIDLWSRTHEPLPYRQGQSVLLLVCNETNEPIGWVNFYQPTKENLLRAHIGVPENALVLEVAYAKSFGDWPENSEFVTDRPNLNRVTYPGVAISGLRQGIDLVNSMESNNMSPRPIYITAFTDPKNLASENVLLKNGFAKQPEQIEIEPYEGKNNVWVKRVAPEDNKL